LAERDEWRSEDRFLYLVGEITDEQTREIMGRLLQHWDREFLLVISSDGGSSFNALCLANLMRQHGKVDTLCIGVALSGAADCLAAGRRRYIVPGAIAMLHQVSWELGREFAANLVKNAEFLHRLNAQMAERLTEMTGRPREQLDRDMATDFYLFGQEILDYGLADAYWDPAQLIPPSPRHRGRLQGASGEARPRRRRREDR
jgi:ATP-dependent Clp protease, protease subunit